MRALAAAVSAPAAGGRDRGDASAGRSIWPGAALLVVLTPTATYTTSLAAPNGVELGGAVLLWSCLLGLSRAPTPTAQVRPAPGRGAVAGAVPLLTVRSMGPLWFCLILGTWLLLSGARGVARSPPPLGRCSSEPPWSSACSVRGGCRLDARRRHEQPAATSRSRTGVALAAHRRRGAAVAAPGRSPPSPCATSPSPAAGLRDRPGAVLAAGGRGLEDRPARVRVWPWL